MSYIFNATVKSELSPESAAATLPLSPKKLAEYQGSESDARATLALLIAAARSIPTDAEQPGKGENLNVRKKRIGDEVLQAYQMSRDA